MHCMQVAAMRPRQPGGGRRCRAAAAAGAATAAAGSSAASCAPSVASLTAQEVQDCLQQRRLCAAGEEVPPAELRARLAAFLADPSAFPAAHCRPRPTPVLGGRLFGGKGLLRAHIQMLLALLQGQEVAEGHPDFAFLLALLRQHPRFSEKVGGWGSGGWGWADCICNKGSQATRWTGRAAHVCGGAHRARRRRPAGRGQRDRLSRGHVSGARHAAHPVFRVPGQPGRVGRL